MKIKPKKQVMRRKEDVIRDIKLSSYMALRKIGERILICVGIDEKRCSTRIIEVEVKEAIDKTVKPINKEYLLELINQVKW